MSALLKDLDLAPIATRLNPEPASVRSEVSPAVDELSDEDLEHVVGGLTRAWPSLEGGPAAARSRFGGFPEPTGLPVAGEPRP